MDKVKERMSVLSSPELDKLIPKLARDEAELKRIQEEVATQKTVHSILVGDSQDISFIRDESVHLVLTSPPYWNLKEYNDHEEQLGHIDDYKTFLEKLDSVWRGCYQKLAVGGRMVVVVGDVLRSRREHGRHKVVPLHADIQVRCEKIGFDNLAPLIWHKIANASFEVKGNSKFLGKPYEPNAVIKHDLEYILMLRKGGGYRTPTPEQRRLSVISEPEFNEWFQQIWTLTGASTQKGHPAPFPEKLAHRLIRMFSFVGDTVLDPFLGSGTTMLAAAKVGRNSIGIEVDKTYAEQARQRFEKAFGMFDSETIYLNYAKVPHEQTVAA
ncbi:MAG: site-specific DNA-methyltransferase [Chloracidobacterium sp.]|nr:site-specific DNA-methyltransferase [Chloracidobacterium sp.]